MFSGNIRTAKQLTVNGRCALPVFVNKEQSRDHHHQLCAALQSPKHTSISLGYPFPPGWVPQESRSSTLGICQDQHSAQYLPHCNTYLITPKLRSNRSKNHYSGKCWKHSTAPNLLYIYIPFKILPVLKKIAHYESGRKIYSHWKDDIQLHIEGGVVKGREGGTKKRRKGLVRVAQVAEHLPSKHEALSQTLIPPKIK
jgi:hypothetical protein